MDIICFQWQRNTECFIWYSLKLGYLSKNKAPSCNWPPGLPNNPSLSRVWKVIPGMWDFTKNGAGFRTWLPPGSRIQQNLARDSSIWKESGMYDSHEKVAGIQDQDSLPDSVKTLFRNQNSPEKVVTHINSHAYNILASSVGTQVMQTKQACIHKQLFWARICT